VNAPVESFEWDVRVLLQRFRIQIKYSFWLYLSFRWLDFQLSILVILPALKFQLQCACGIYKGRRHTLPQNRYFSACTCHLVPIVASTEILLYHNRMAVTWYSLFGWCNSIYDHVTDIRRSELWTTHLPRRQRLADLLLSWNSSSFRHIIRQAEPKLDLLTTDFMALLTGCSFRVWPESESELYRPTDSRLSEKLVPTFADRGCHKFSATDTHGRILGFLYRRRYYFFQVAPQLYSRSWVDPVPYALLRKSGSAGSRTRDLWICSQELWPLDHRGDHEFITVIQ
jgi:hypothetical protein